MSPSVIPVKHAKPTTAKKPAGHPPFAEMINDALVVLKERNGSSQVAIQKFIEEKYKNLPTTFRKLLLVQLKRMAASGKLVRVKHSFKLAPSSKPALTNPKPKAKGSSTASKPKAKGGVSAKEKKSDATGTKKRKVTEKPAVKAKPITAVKAARTSKKLTSPGQKNTEKKMVAKPKKTVWLGKVKSPVKKAKPKRAKAVKVMKK